LDKSIVGTDDIVQLAHKERKCIDQTKGQVLQNNVCIGQIKKDFDCVEGILPVHDSELKRKTQSAFK